MPGALRELPAEVPSTTSTAPSPPPTFREAPFHLDPHRLQPSSKSRASSLYALVNFSTCAFKGSAQKTEKIVRQAELFSNWSSSDSR